VPIPIVCPECRHSFQADDSKAGDTISCPSCGKSLAVPGKLAAGSPIAETPLPPDDYRRRPASISDYENRADVYDDIDTGRPSNASRWGSSLSGLRLLYWAMWLFLVPTLIVQSMMLATGDPAAVAAGGAAVAPLFVMVSAVMGCASLIASVLSFVGVCLCCSAPDGRARSRAITALVLGLCSVVVAIVLVVVAASTLFVLFRGQGQPAAPPAMEEILEAVGTRGIAIGILVGLLAIAAFVFWILFHVAVASRFGDTTLRSHCLAYLTVWVAMALAGWTLQIVNATVLPPDWAMAFLRFMNGYALVQCLVIYGWYLWICARTIRAIRTGAAHEDEMPADE
jgi:hypothetical protein